MIYHTSVHIIPDEMEVEPGAGWADALSKILRMGTKNPAGNRILSKAKLEKHDESSESEDDNSEDQVEVKRKSETTCLTLRLKPEPQADALVENELKSDATRGVVHLFNAVKTVNPKSDKKKKKKKKKKGKIKKIKGKAKGKARRPRK